MWGDLPLVWSTRKRSDIRSARSPEGYTLRAYPLNGSWHWSLRPPGGGYDLASGSESSPAPAMAEAELALQRLLAKIRRRSG